jgi:hypothetical protein
MRPGPYGLLLATVLACVAVQGAAPPGDVQQIVVSVLLGASLVLAVRVARVKPGVMRLAIALALAGVAVNLAKSLGDVVGEGEVRAMNAAVVLLGPPAVAAGLLRTLRVTHEVRLEAVSGVLSLYVLLGLLFAFLFGAVDRLGDGAFFASGQPASVSNCLYFSFTTLTTVGYGDFAARTDLGHTLCVFEMLIGQIYLVTVVSLIVSNLRRPREVVDRPPDR